MTLQDWRRTIKARSALAVLALCAISVTSAPVAAQSPQAQPPLPKKGALDCLSGEAMAGGLSYVPGRGLRFGDSGLVLGGYTSLDLLRDEGEPARLTLEDLSFFIIYQPIARFSFFSELEIENLFSIDSDGETGRADERFEVERLYGDVDVSARLRLRVGKFLTPVGRWNVIHARPLVWTTSRPLVTEVPFDENTTGAMLTGGVLDDRVRFDVFGQATDQFEPTPQVVVADRSGGGRVTWEPSPSLSVGSTYMAFRSADDWFHLVGGDALWSIGRAEWMSEVEIDVRDDDSATQWGLYSQVAVEVVSQIFAVGRYEYFNPRGAQRHLNQVVVGAAYRLRPYAVFKVEYQIADRSSDLSEPGFRSSFAVLF